MFSSRFSWIFTIWISIWLFFLTTYKTLFCLESNYDNTIKYKYVFYFIIFFVMFKKVDPKRLSIIFILVISIFLLVFWIDIFLEYRAQHDYYGTMLLSGSNISLVIGSILFAAIPVLTLIYSKKVSIKKIIMLVWLALWMFGLFHLSKFWGTVGSWGLIYLVNISILFWLGIYLVLWLQALWGRLSRLIFKFKEFNLNQLLINFGLWLVVFMLINWILIGLWLFYPIVAWLIFFSFWFLIWWERKRSLQNSKEIIIDVFSKIQISNTKWKRYLRFFVILLCLSLAYYFYGLNLSFLPYPTAWDANHEYMYIPKVLAEYGWVLRWNGWAGSTMPYLRHWYITYWFSLFGDWFWLSEDTMAISMNFLSWIFVLLLSLWLLDIVLKFLWAEKGSTRYNIWFITGWIITLLWLTSGMWAFLVFVDNKTDLWVMVLTILAVISWFILLNKVKEDNTETQEKELTSQTKLESAETHTKSDNWKYLILSWLFFAAWIMAKPTAFIDIAVFVVLITMLWFNGIFGIGLWLMITWFMWILKPLKASLFISPELWKLLMIIWLWLVVVWIISMLINKNKLKFKIQYLKDLFIWWISMVLFVLILKWPWLAYRLQLQESLHIDTFSRWLLAQSSWDAENQTWTWNTLDEMLLTNIADEEYSKTLIPTLSECETIDYTESELYDDLVAFGRSVSDDDFGRYVWYRWYDMPSGSLWYSALRLFYPKDDTCYGLNSDAKILCENQTAISLFDTEVLSNIQEELSDDSDVKQILDEAFAYAEELKNSWEKVTATSMKDHIWNLQTYYQDHSIYTTQDSLNVPYRYIIPLNIVFNRSLQNRSSYYTDIGFVWLLFFGLIAAGWIFALYKRDWKYFALTTATIFWWVIWGLIASAILWYWIWLITWTGLVVLWLFQDLFISNTDNKNKKHQIYFWVLFWIFIFWSLIQLCMNFIRISTQWGAGPFTRYKQSVWIEQIVNNDLSVEQNIRSWYWMQDVFNLQFGHYNKTISELKDRNEEDWVYVAWTYLPYFLEKQMNIKYDNMLGFMYKMSSDQDVCKTYQRLKDQKVKYIVFDPNIWTVVMWDGNQWLFDRFLAKFDPVTWAIDEHWALSMLVELKKNWYLDYISSNNLWTKYWFQSTDEELKTFLVASRWWNITQKDIDKFRLQLSVPRFFLNTNPEIWNYIINKFNERMQNGQALSDLADMQQKHVNTDILAEFFTAYATQDQQETLAVVNKASQDERITILSYLNLLDALTNQQTEYNQTINDMLIKNLWAGSQIIFLELE